jgi:Predicted xylanase/chitin deacetylase
MKVCITIDMEHDCPPFMDTYRGVEEGTPLLLELFEKTNIRTTFFTTGDVARHFPITIQSIVDAGHELGCHGDTHAPFDTLDRETARREIQNSMSELRRFYPVQSFRAPNLRFPDEYLPLLEEADIRLDASQAKYKPTYWFRKHCQTKLKRVPASITSSVLRLPIWVRCFFLQRLKDPAILFVHPWEFVDFRSSNLRLDCRFRTGEVALFYLEDTIDFYVARGGEFLRMCEL